jgi:hypothetical protein
MPPKKGTSTPNNPIENPTWTLDEGEEMYSDGNAAPSPPTGRKVHAHSQDLLSPSARRTQRFFYFPIGKICTHIFSSMRLPFVHLSGNRNSQPCKFSVDRGALESPRPDVSVKTDFLSLYRDFVSIMTSLLTIPSPRFSNLRYTMR